MGSRTPVYWIGVCERIDYQTNKIQKVLEHLDKNGFGFDWHGTVIGGKIDGKNCYYLEGSVVFVDNYVVELLCLTRKKVIELSKTLNLELEFIKKSAPQPTWDYNGDYSERYGIDRTRDKVEYFNRQE